MCNYDNKERKCTEFFFLIIYGAHSQNHFMEVPILNGVLNILTHISISS